MDELAALWIVLPIMHITQAFAVGIVASDVMLISFLKI